jgi:hypothetical protein
MNKFICKKLLSDGSVCGQIYYSHSKPQGLKWKDGHKCEPEQDKTSSDLQRDFHQHSIFHQMKAKEYAKFDKTMLNKLENLYKKVN